MQHRACVLFVLLLVTGCTPTAEVAWLSESTYTPLEANQAIQLTTGDLDKAYEEMAIITVWAERTFKERNVLEKLNELLRMEARALGADAVVRIDYEMQTSTGEADLKQSATGTAVRTTRP